MESASVGGPAKNLIEFARQAGTVDLRIATFQRGAALPPSAFVEAARDAGIPVEVIAERGRFDFGVLPQLRSVVARLGPDIIQTHNVKSHLLVRLAGLRRSIPWIAFHHGYTARDLRDRLYRHFDRLSLPAADHVVTVCRPFAAQIRGYGVPAARISVLHNSVTPYVAPSADLVTATRARFGLAEEVPVILAVGRLSREKGHCDLIDAVARLKQVRLVLVGDGPARGRIEKHIRALGLSNSVVLCGHQDDVRPFYAIAAVLALPSHSEGSPNVLLEAMAAGVPVVATAVGGVPEIATDGETALLVPKGDVPAMAEALARVLDEPAFAQAMARRAQPAVLSSCRPEEKSEWIINLYRTVLAQRQRRPL
jgi:glycosyltransferase involved in cell wall biosynthesis